MNLKVSHPRSTRLAGSLLFVALAAGGGLLPSCGTPTAPAPAAPALDAASASASASAVDASSPPIEASSPIEAGLPPVDAAKACGLPGRLDVDARRDGRYRGTQLSGPDVNVRLVDACLGSGQPVRGAGLVRVAPSTGAAFYVRVDPVTPGYYPSVSEIWNFEYPDVRAYMPIHLVSQGGDDPQVERDPIPDPFAAVWNPSKAHFVVQLDAVGACGTGGYRLTVVGHPEAKVMYSGGTFVPDPTLDETGSNDAAFAFISNVNPGPGTLEIAGTNGPCRVAPPTLLVPVNSGKYPIIAGTATEVTLVTTSD